MIKDDNELNKAFIYTFASNEEEFSLCQLEMRSFFGVNPKGNIIKSSIEVDPSRSPFMKERIEVMYAGSSLGDIIEQVQQIQLDGATFKVIFVKMNDLAITQKIEYKERRLIEREIGANINGEADVHQPDKLFGIITLGGCWYFGKYQKSEPIWLYHMNKPRQYSTALSTRLARAIANIAVPNPNGVTAIDPCCGIGTVLVEALSMGINIIGRDINPLVTSGSRENIAYFGLSGEVILGPISAVTNSYDVAIIDMPYNLATHATPEEQLSILKHARTFAAKLVVISIDIIDQMINEAGFEITDRCVAKKGAFSRQIMVCR